MDDKRIVIGTGNDMITMLYGTGVKGSPETKESSTDTFSGAVVQGKKKIAWTLDINKIRCENMEQHMALCLKVEDMLDTADDITVIETVYPEGDAPYEVIEHYFSCITTGNDFEVKPTDNTVENLKFKASSHSREWKKL